MKLESLKDILEVGGEKVLIMDKLRTEKPELFNESGQMDYKLFEKDIRPNYHIYVRHDVGSVSFTIQDGPIEEVGKNGCQWYHMVEIALLMIKSLNAKFPCRENSLTITKLEEALMWNEKRTKDRVDRGVEGSNKG